jgi:hypothetical protein
LIRTNDGKPSLVRSPLDNDGTILDAITRSSTSTTPDMLETDRPARSFRHSGGVAQPKGDGSSNIRTAFFEILGACVGVATLIVAVLALRAMPKQHQHDPESPPVTNDGDVPSVGAELEQLPRHGTSNQEPDMVQPAVDTQCHESEPSS